MKGQGMPKREAEKRIAAGEFTWADLRALLANARADVRKTQTKPCRGHKAIPRAIAFNAFRRAASRLEGLPESTDHVRLAVDILREFGTAKPKKSKGK